ncbi:TetR/AcrR family transcriptional regulator [Thiohalorhabdus sp. Cl-TMA]|uniref:TetR/AcrR family transcriptional regulator n=1 Tax=Thiohalorhabdus methylotrophus TaxID=3242694 RepID=A0ABV4TX70_9GAMM
MTEVRESADGCRRITEVAARLFARHGFKGVSMAALAREAGLSKAAIFHHFPSKEALYYHVILQACQETTAFLQGVLGEDEQAEKALAEFARYHIHHLFNHAQVGQLIFRELLDGESERIRTLAQEVYGDNFQRMVELVQRGQEAGLFGREHDPALVTTVLVGSQIFFFQAREMLSHTPGIAFADDPDQFAEGMLHLLMEGLKPR